MHWMQTLFLPFLAVIGALIAYQQATTARVKLQHDLFDRRYKTFSFVNTFVGNVVSQSDTNLSELFSFQRDVSDAKFFFDEDVIRYIDQTRKMAGALYAAKSLNFPNQSEDRRLRASDDANKCEQWFLEQVEIVPEVFKKSMFIPTLKPFGTIIIDLFKHVKITSLH